MTVQHNHRTPVRGIQTISRLVDPAGQAAETTTLITVNDDAVLEQWANAGLPVHQLKGDGRLWLRILSAAPLNPVAGDVWLEQDLVDGLVLRIRSTTGTQTLIGGTGDAIELTAGSALLQGHAVRASGPGLVYAQAAANQHRLLGIMAADTASGGQGGLITMGSSLELPDWSLLTGAAALTVGAQYWLSATPGRYTATPVAGFAARVGIALTANRLLVDSGLTVLG